MAPGPPTGHGMRPGHAPGCTPRRCPIWQNDTSQYRIATATTTPPPARWTMWTSRCTCWPSTPSACTCWTYLQPEELASLCEEADCWSSFARSRHCGFHAVPAHRSTHRDYLTVTRLAGAPGMVSAGPRLSGVAVLVRGGSVIFDSLTGRLSWVCRLGKCPGGTPWHTPGGRLWKGHFTRRWLFRWLWCGEKYIRKSSTTSRDGRI